MNEQQKKKLRNQLIVALDLDTPEEALAVVDALAGTVERFKIGSRMFTAVGPSILHQLGDRGAKVFLDLKYHDIPSVVGDAVRIVAQEHPSVFLTTVHASGGPAMVAAAAEAATMRTTDKLSVVAVTALTSLSPAETRILGVEANLDDWAAKLAELAIDAGADGIVCSARELEMMRDLFGPAPTIVTPGIRPDPHERQPGDDQARVMSPRAALDAGSSYLVMGRPVYQAEDPLAVVQAIGATL